MLEIIFFKNRIPNMRFWIIYFLDQISFCWGLLWGVLASVFHLIFRRRPTMVGDIFTPPSSPLLTHTHIHTHTIKQLSMALALYNLWDMFLHGELLENIWVRLGLKLAKCLLDWCYQYSFLRLFVTGMFTNLNMNDNNGKIRLAKKKAFKL